ncbi:antitoxin Xre/MbcA/ParS toxin-binding domain-containing protein [Pseudomonas chlororaphis]|uniref:antitoxin Xre/MbcA/ParS toxin-binding domain-containing protein n=1 Tax=Pseudomonas chlororaphis TaxID=587753 RepID=UPI003BF5540B
MLAIYLLGPCLSARPRCWSSQYRCFVARRDQVQNQAAYVLGNDRLASEWLMRPALSLGKRTPCSLLVDTKGFRQVCEHLMRIEYGVYMGLVGAAPCGGLIPAGWAHS